MASWSVGQCFSQLTRVQGIYSTPVLSFLLIYFNYLSLLAAIYVAGIQGALAMEPLLSNAQIGDVVFFFAN